MKTYIQPSTEIVAVMELSIMDGSDLHDTKGSSTYTFTNTTEFEADLQQVESKSLWDD